MGGQRSSRGPGRRVYEELEEREETYDLEAEEKICPHCGLVRTVLAEPDHSELT
jgi:hypothetical protein